MHLLDTPKKKILQSQANSIRLGLKEYERTFAAEHNGRKPSRDEIKGNKTIAASYQQYQTIRDVLVGRLGIEVLKTPERRQATRKLRERADSAVSLTPRRTQKGSPSKSRDHPNELDPYDAPSSQSPKVLPRAIGPTPHRDGTILGIFDFLSNSGSRNQSTPSSRKRKIDALYGHESRDGAGQQEIAQTPSQKRRQSSNHAATPRSSMATGKRNLSKTPVSDGKKFMLNQFFATPSAVRYAGMLAGNGEAATPAQSKTPLRDFVFGITPIQGNKSKAEAAANDATPPYLKRSFSFKERLLSASGGQMSTSTDTKRRLNGSLRHARFAPKPLSQIIADRQQADDEEKHQHQEPRYDEEDDEDDLDALREMEASEFNVLVEDSQIMDEAGQVLSTSKLDEEEPTRVWKKKGQKRSTRRVMMRPVKVQPAEAPKPKQKVATLEVDEEVMDEEDEEDDNNISLIEETQLPDTPTATPDTDMRDLDDPDIEYLDDLGQVETAKKDLDDEDAFLPEDNEDTRPQKKAKSRTTPSTKKPKKKSTVEDVDKPVGKSPKPKKAAKDTDADENSGRKISPNAVSHMNFRSLKIKNKNSKAKGRGRFGRR